MSIPNVSSYSDSNSHVQDWAIAQIKAGIQYGLSQRQIAWAKSHDWYLYETLDGKGVWVQDCDYESVSDGHTVRWIEHPKTVAFYDFAKLRAWAGY